MTGNDTETPLGHRKGLFGDQNLQDSDDRLSQMAEVHDLEITLGALTQSVACECPLSALRIIGFVRTDMSLVFSSMTPLRIGPGFLRALATAMDDRCVDAVACSDGDFILRVFSCGQNLDAPKETYILFLCVPSKPLFDARVQDFSYPDFSLSLWG
jgi:hypothetical protein